jgi:hypothetical protein
MAEYGGVPTDTVHVFGKVVDLLAHAQKTIVVDLRF